MTRNVLYIEDNEDAVIFFNRIVNKLGDYKFKITEDGPSAFKLLDEKEFAPEMILLDINLPGMNGFEILQHLRTTNTTYKHVPVIMFTSSDDYKDIEKSYEFGANAYLIKPTNLRSLREVLSDTFNFWLKHNVA